VISAKPASRGPGDLAVSSAASGPSTSDGSGLITAEQGSKILDELVEGRLNAFELTFDECLSAGRK